MFFETHSGTAYATYPLTMADLTPIRAEESGFASHLWVREFQGRNGKHHLLEALRAQPLIQDEDLAAQFAKRVRLEEIARGTTLISAGDGPSDFFLILGGEFDVIVGGRSIAKRSGGQHVGEMAMVEPYASRVATVVAIRDSLVARISEPEFTALANKSPRLWRRIARELAILLRAESGVQIMSAVDHAHAA